ncbi:hypothetical protein [Aquimarina longa]|uniref:hypothetical protein n=1 Tax=Aquimarina longa TaxID=1080221 RepID=UPI000783E7FE|nr:hypothetical protein [Aquimarina longa]
MILGTLSLFQKKGIFYKEQQLSSKDTFTTMLNQQLEGGHTSMKIPDLPNRYQITPVEESGNTDYITATFEDHGMANYPYEIMVWLLVEEFPEEI